jgi:predicted RNA-binding protein with PIN domain
VGRTAPFVAVRLLIDGNNLLHASDVFPSGSDRSTAAAQRALVEVLRRGMSAAEAAGAVIVFDGRPLRPLLSSDDQQEAGLQVLHPRKGEEADTLIESLLEAVAEPTRLVVVSSDHRLQRAARHVGATAVDSEVYWRQWKQRQRSPSEPAIDEKPVTPPAEEVQEWLDRFGPAGEK